MLTVLSLVSSFKMAYNVPTLVAVACDLRLNLTNTNQIVADSGFSEGKTKPKPLLQTCVSGWLYN
jgi:hypothetical protein